mmetsp:Transcript_36840/g.82526  ORF Transcript_36840/g.82526 Transcript_36840/m.82526 type:complete len:292 (+) Transcript_36840:719-1594(+)
MPLQTHSVGAHVLRRLLELAGRCGGGRRVVLQVIRRKQQPKRSQDAANFAAAAGGESPAGAEESDHGHARFAARHRGHLDRLPLLPAHLRHALRHTLVGHLPLPVQGGRHGRLSKHGRPVLSAPDLAKRPAKQRRLVRGRGRLVRGAAVPGRAPLVPKGGGGELRGVDLDARGRVAQLRQPGLRPPDAFRGEHHGGLGLGALLHPGRHGGGHLFGVLGHHRGGELYHREPDDRRDLGPAGRGGRARAAGGPRPADGARAGALAARPFGGRPGGARGASVGGRAARQAEPGP